MQIKFVLCWGTKKLERQFHHSPFLDLFLEYTKRVKKFIPSDVKVTTLDSFEASSDQSVWCCHHQGEVFMPTSELLAQRIQGVMSSSVKTLNILIGPADGFTEPFLKKHGALRWSFGPLTYPHELAAVIASEQIYRALTIIKNHPYHLGHFR